MQTFFSMPKDIMWLLSEPLIKFENGSIMGRDAVYE